MTHTEAILWVELTSTSTAATRFGVDAHQTYRDIAKLCHPDVVPVELKARAEKATVKLNTLYASLNGKGKPKSAVLIGDWVVEEPLAKGDICDLHKASSAKFESAVLKIAQTPRDNDLVEQEAKALKILAADPLSANFKHYVPRLYATFQASGRRTNVISYADKHHSLADILTLYPNGLDFRVCGWMFNRILSTIGWAHSNGLVHGAIFPEHLLYDANHHLTLVDWCYSVDAGHPLKAIIKKHRYPPEVLRKKEACAGLDIYMAARVIRQAAASVPKRFNDLFAWCQAESPRARPADAWQLQDQWRALLKEEFGAPKFVEFKLPTQ